MENKMRKLIVLFCFIIIAASASGQKKIKWTEMKGPIFANIETDVVLPENCKLSSGKVEASYDSGESWRLVGTKCTNDSKLIIYSPNDSEKIKLRYIQEKNIYPRYKNKQIISSNSNYSQIYKTLFCSNGDYYVVGVNNGILPVIDFYPEKRYEYVYIILFDKFNKVKNHAIMSHPLETFGNQIVPRDYILDKNDQLHLLITFRDRIKVGNLEYKSKNSNDCLLYVNFDLNLNVKDSYKFEGLYFLNSSQLTVDINCNPIFMINCSSSNLEFKGKNIQISGSTYVLLKFKNMNEDKFIFKTLSTSNNPTNAVKKGKLFSVSNNKNILIVNSFGRCTYDDKELIDDSNNSNKYCINYIVIDNDLNLINNKYYSCDEKLDYHDAVLSKDNDLYICGIAKGKLDCGKHRILDATSREYCFLMKFNNSGIIENLEKLGWSNYSYYNTQLYIDKETNLYFINKVNKFTSKLTDFTPEIGSFYISKYNEKFEELWSLKYNRPYSFAMWIDDLSVDNNGLMYVVNNDNKFSINNVNYDYSAENVSASLDIFEMVKSEDITYESDELQLINPIVFNNSNFSLETTQVNNKVFKFNVKNISNKTINIEKFRFSPNDERDILINYSKNELKPQENVVMNLYIETKSNAEIYDTLFITYGNGFKEIACPFYCYFCLPIEYNEYINLGDIKLENDTIIEIELAGKLDNCKKEFLYLKLNNESNDCRILNDNLEFPIGYPIKIKLFLNRNIKGFYTNTILFADNYFVNNAIVDRKCMFVLKALNKTSESSDDRSSEILPNPVDEYFILKNINEIIDFDIYDVTGRIVKQVRSAVPNQKVDISELRSGCYYIKINNAENKKFYKFIKN